MKKGIKMLAAVTAGLFLISGAACEQGEKEITVVVREAGSGTREAFDKVVTDGVRFLEERSLTGKKVCNVTKKAIEQNKTAAVLSTVERDKNAIAYASIGTLNDGVKSVLVEGVEASEGTVLSGDYQIQRPFVIMTGRKVALTPRAADFMAYLQSDEMEAHAKTAGCIFLADERKRAGEGETPIPVQTFTPDPLGMPAGDKIIVKGSTSIEKLINAAAKGYANAYGVQDGEVGKYFDVQLEGSSVGKKAAKEDETGNVIGLSSAWVKEEGIRSFNVCLDAVAVIVNKRNEKVNDLTLKELYDIFSGKIKKFSEITE